jgi:hypothetical protein
LRIGRALGVAVKTDEDANDGGDECVLPHGDSFSNGGMTVPTISQPAISQWTSAPLLRNAHGDEGTRHLPHAPPSSLPSLIALSLSGFTCKDGARPLKGQATPGQWHPLDPKRPPQGNRLNHRKDRSRTNHTASTRPIEDRQRAARGSNKIPVDLLSLDLKAQPGCA